MRAAIVLGHYPAGTQTPTDAQTARCLKAFELYARGRINKIIVTGGFTRGHISEARMMKIALVVYGVPEDVVIEEELASSTIENAFFSTALFDRLGWKKRAILISQAGHLWRAKTNYEAVGFKIKNAAAKTAPEAADFELLPEEESTPPARELPDLTIVFEPFSSREPLLYPAPGQARRLRAVATLYRKNKIKKVMVYSDWYTRGPVDIAEIMQIALISLGVPEKDIIMKNRIHYSKFNLLDRLVPEWPALVITTAGLKDNINPDSEDFLFWFLD